MKSHQHLALLLPVLEAARTENLGAGLRIEERHFLCALRDELLALTPEETARLSGYRSSHPEAFSGVSLRDPENATEEALLSSCFEAWKADHFSGNSEAEERLLRLGLYERYLRRLGALKA